MATKTEAYVDTSAFIAFVDSSDSYHAVFNRLFADSPKLATTPLVAEGHGWFLRRYDRFKALQFIGLIESLDMLTIANSTHADRNASFAVLRQHLDQDLKLVDALGIHVMVSRSSQICWSTDFHLGLSGVPLVINSRSIDDSL